MERTTFCLLFYIRRTKLNRNGEAPIMMRITVNGVRVDASVKKTILPEFWSAAKGKALEKKREYKELNLYLDSIRLRIMKIQRELEIEEVSVSANSVLDRFQGKDAPVQRTLPQTEYVVRGHPYPKNGPGHCRQKPLHLRFPVHAVFSLSSNG